MKEFNKKQKIIMICICIVLIGIILYYVYGKEEMHVENQIIPYEDIQENSDNNIIEENDNKEEKNEIIIYIIGEVNKEGVYVLEEGSRIADAIDIAGGLTDEADTKEINLAYIVEDGMKIEIPNKTDKQENNIYITKESGINTDIVENRSVTSNVKSNTKSSSKVNINTATQEELETLTGIGPSTANKIIEHRKNNGNFKKIEDIKNVSGIGESKYNKIKDQISIKP